MLRGGMGLLRRGGAVLARRALSSAAHKTNMPLTERPGELWSWGHNDDGHVRVPQVNEAAQGTQFAAVSCGLYHSAALATDAQLHTWGRGEGGRLGNREQDFSINRGGAIPLHSPDPFPVDVVSPLSEYGVTAEEMPRIVGSSCGGLHTLMLMSDGRVMACGFGRFGQLGLGFSGGSTQPNPLQILTLHPAVSIAAGGSHSAAVCDNGNVYTWGRGAQGRLGYKNAHETEHDPRCVEVLSGLGIGSVACGGFHTGALAEDGKRLWMWGGGENGELGNGNSQNCVEPRLVQELEGEPLKGVSLGGFHSAAVTESGDVLTWGMGTVGQLGHGDDKQQLIPKRLKGVPPAIQVSCGGVHTAIVTRGGELWVFGGNGEGQLGLDIKSARSPHMVEAFGDSVSFVSCGGSQTAVIKSDN